MYNIFIPLLLIFKWVHCIPTRCLTDSEGAAKNKPCAFPFVFKNKLFEKCTDFEDLDGKNWCSTKTDTNNNHVSGKGNWGYCREVCLETTTGMEVLVPQMGMEQTLYPAGHHQLIPLGLLADLVREILVDKTLHQISNKIIDQIMGDQQLL